MKSFNKAILGMVFSLGFSATSSANIVLDNFTYNDVANGDGDAATTLFNFENDAGYDYPSNGLYVGTSNVGADVYYFLDPAYPANAGGTASVANASYDFGTGGYVADNALMFSNDTYSASNQGNQENQLNIFYDGSSIPALPLPLLGEAFYVEGIDTDGTSGDFEVSLTVYSGTDSTTWSDTFPSVDYNAGGDLLVSFDSSEWVDSLGWDDLTSWFSVDSILVSITGASDIDLTIGSFNIVPAPAMLGLLGLGLMGVGFSRRRAAK